MTVGVIRPDGGEILQVGSMRTRVLEDGSGTAGRLGVVEVTLLPGEPGPPQHLHREHDETFYVLSGSIRFDCGSETVTAGPGSLLTAKIGMPHTFGNANADVPAVILGTVSPDRYINYFRELDGLTEGGKRFEPAQVLEVMSRYATEPYRPPAL
jgi:mannose-6-phosphate isomerase-like protein (cupin superfamily)